MLVTVADLTAYMDRTRLTNRQEDAAELVLAGLQSELETILRRPVEVDEYVEEHTVPEDYLRYQSFYHSLRHEATPFTIPPFVLPVRNSPIVTVTQVRWMPAPPAGNPGWRILSDQVDYTVRRWGLDLYRVAANDRIEVTYTGGLDGAAIPFLKLSILRAAAREMLNQVDDVVGLKEMQTQQAAERATGFTEEEQRVLKRWKRRQVST